MHGKYGRYWDEEQRCTESRRVVTNSAISHCCRWMKSKWLYTRRNFFSSAKVCTWPGGKEAAPTARLSVSMSRSPLSFMYEPIERINCLKTKWNFCSVKCSSTCERELLFVRFPCFAHLPFWWEQHVYEGCSIGGVALTEENRSTGRETDVFGQKPKQSDKNLFHRYLVHEKPHKDWPVIEPGPPHKETDDWAASWAMARQN